MELCEGPMPLFFISCHFTFGWSQLWMLLLHIFCYFHLVVIYFDTSWIRYPGYCSFSVQSSSFPLQLLMFQMDRQCLYSILSRSKHCEDSRPIMIIVCEMAIECFFQSLIILRCLSCNTCHSSLDISCKDWRLEDDIWALTVHSMAQDFNSPGHLIIKGILFVDNQYIYQQKVKLVSDNGPHAPVLLHILNT